MPAKFPRVGEMIAILSGVYNTSITALERSVTHGYVSIVDDL